MFMHTHTDTQTHAPQLTSEPTSQRTYYEPITNLLQPIYYEPIYYEPTNTVLTLKLCHPEYS